VFQQASETKTEEDDQALDRALAGEPDPLLVASLKRDERRRRRRLVITACAGGLIMGAIIATSVLWLVFGAQVTAADKDKAAQLTVEAFQLWQDRKFDEAAKRFNEAIKVDPKNANAWNGLGWARFNGGDPSGAAEAFAKAIQIQPKHGAALNGLGQVELVQGKHAEAEKHLLAAAQNNAQAAWWGLTKIYLLKENWAEAEKWAAKIVAADPENAEAKQMLDAAKAKKLPPELKQQLAPPTTKEQASSPETTKGWRHFNKGENAQAIEAFEAALKKNPNDLAAVNGLGFALLNSGDAAAARPHFERYLKENPTAAGPLNGLARAQMSEGDVDGAIATWEKMVKSSPGVNAGTSGLAWAYLERKEFDKALPYFEQLAKAMPDDKSVKDGLARARAGAGKNVEAKPD
jgi:tetratricopeptide (TPR) repeat protein